MVIVVDFDGTLALGDTSNIENMSPNSDLINKINQIYDDGNYIKVVTARGSKSCNNLVEKKEKYFKKIESWLNNNKVKFHEISFNKEYGDIYLDDKCFNINQTKINYIKLDSKFTQNKVRKFNNFVIKKSETILDEVRWYKLANEYNLNTPKLIHYDIDTIITEYIVGKKCKDKKLIIETFSIFKNLPHSNNCTFEKYVKRIENYLKLNNLNNYSDFLNDLSNLKIPNTFCHGDFSIDNIIESDKKLFLIDPINNENVYQSYYIDIAKYLYTILFYELDYHHYYEIKNEILSYFGIDEITIDLLIICESLRVSNRKKQLLDITKNLLNKNYKI